MSVYNPLVPTGTVKFPQDYKNIQGNFNQANVVYGTDHFPFDNVTSGQEGFHNKVTLPNRADPTTGAAQGMVYAKNSASTPGRTDLYYAYQTAGGTDFTGNFFPLNIIKAFGRAVRSGGGTALVAGSSFNVTGVAFAASNPDTWTINLTSPICSVGDIGKVMVLALPEASAFFSDIVCMSAPVASTTQILVYTNRSVVTAISFAILVI